LLISSPQQTINPIPRWFFSKTATTATTWLLLLKLLIRVEAPKSVKKRKRERRGFIYLHPLHPLHPLPLHTHCSPSSHITIPLPYSLPPSSYCPLSHLHPLSYVIFLLHTLLKEKEFKDWYETGASNERADKCFLF
jgi:hypothetical protein